MPGFTAVAAGIGLATTAATTTGSFIQAGKQRDAMLNAQKKADDAMKEARKKLDVNVYAALEIPEKAYGQQIEANLIAGAQAIQSGVEGETRGAGAIAGMVQGAQTEAMNKISADKEQALYNLQAATAQEEARNRDIGIQMDLGDVEGAQLAAANAQELSAQALQQGMQGVTSLAGQVASMAPLYEKSASTRQYNKLIKENVGDQPGQYKTIQDFQNSLPDTKSTIDLSGVGSTTDSDYMDNQIATLMSKMQAAGTPITKEDAAKQITRLMTGNQFMDYMIQQDKNQLKGLRRDLNSDIIRF